MMTRASLRVASIAGACLAAIVVTLALGAGAALAAPVVGFVEEWPGISLSGWTGGSLGIEVSNPGAGGFLGAGDGYLLVKNSTVTHLGANSSGAEYTGDWVAAGITHVIVFLNDVGAADPLEIHFSIGRSSSFPTPQNFWQYNKGFIPPAGTWGEFDVDLTDVANYTKIIGLGPETFQDALQNVDRIHFRHDKSPFTQTPDFILGDFGIDHLVLANAAAGVEPGARVAVGRPVELAPPAPNPSRGAVTLLIRSFEPGPVHLQVVDASGRLVRRAELAAGPAGPRSWTWDGADEQGRAAAPGVYRVRAWGAAGGTSQPVVRIR